MSLVVPYWRHVLWLQEWNLLCTYCALCTCSKPKGGTVSYLHDASAIWPFHSFSFILNSITCQCPKCSISIFGKHILIVSNGEHPSLWFILMIQNLHLRVLVFQSEFGEKIQDEMNLSRIQTWTCCLLYSSPTKCTKVSTSCILFCTKWQKVVASACGWCVKHVNYSAFVLVVLVNGGRWCHRTVW